MARIRKGKVRKPVVVPFWVKVSFENEGSMVFKGTQVWDLSGKRLTRLPKQGDTVKCPWQGQLFRGVVEVVSTTEIKLTRKDTPGTSAPQQLKAAQRKENQATRKAQKANNTAQASKALLNRNAMSFAQPKGKEKEKEKANGDDDDEYEEYDEDDEDDDNDDRFVEYDQQTIQIESESESEREREEVTESPSSLSSLATRVATLEKKFTNLRNYMDGIQAIRKPDGDGRISLSELFEDIKVPLQAYLHGITQKLPGNRAKVVLKYLFTKEELMEGSLGGERPLNRTKVEALQAYCLSCEGSDPTKTLREYLSKVCSSLKTGKSDATKRKLGI